MSWIRTRTIHGKTYLYQETRYRDGQSVRSISRYIGAIDTVTGEMSVLIDDFIEDTPQASLAIRKRQRATRKGASQAVGLGQTSPVLLSEVISKLKAQKAQKEAKSGAQALRPSKDSKKPSRDNSLAITAELKPYGFSERSMRREHGAIAEAMAKAGYDPSKMPRVIVRRSSLLGAIASPRSGGVSLKKKLGSYVLTLPYSMRRGTKTATREALRREYRRALAFSMLDGMQRQKPGRFQEMERKAQGAFKRRTEALSRYIDHTGSKTRLARRLALSWGLVHPIPTGKSTKLDPEALTLGQYGKRQDWRDETADLISEALKLSSARKTAQKGRERPQGSSALASGLLSIRNAQNAKAGRLSQSAKIQRQKLESSGLWQGIKRSLWSKGKDGNQEKRLKRTEARADLHREQVGLIDNLLM